MDALWTTHQARVHETFLRDSGSRSAETT